MKKILILLAITTTTITTTVAQKPAELNLQSTVIEYAKPPVDIAITLPFLTDPNNTTLAKNINQDACTTVQTATNLFNNKQTAAPATNPELLELQLLSLAKNHTQTNTQIPFSAYSDWTTFANQHLVTVFQKIYLYNGGANGMTFVTFNNYSLKTGEKIDIAKEIKNKKGFMKLIATHFCRERKLPQDAPQVITGLKMELENLPFPKHIGITRKGIVALYNPYEIAPGSMGVIAIIIPTKELEGIVGDDFFKISKSSGGGKLYNQNRKVEARRHN